MLKQSNTALLFWLLLGSLVMVQSSCAEDEGTFRGSRGAQTPADEPKDKDQKKKSKPKTDEDVKVDKSGLISDEPSAETVPQFGLMVNDLRCALCHLKINGDIVSTEIVEPVWTSSFAVISGNWHTAKDFLANVPSSDPQHGHNVSLTFDSGKKVFPKTITDSMPKDMNGDTKPDFPVIDFAGLPAKMNGSIKQFGKQVSKVATSNLVLIGTDADPIVIEGEVLIKGDLVIKGKYKGIGNIYVTGNIYIPTDLLAISSPFPYATDATEALKQAEASLKRRDDALGLAAKGSIILSDFEDRPNSRSPFKHPATPAESNYAAIKAGRLYSWYPGGQIAYEKLYSHEGTSNCKAIAGRDAKGTISRVDAFLYALEVIGGKANHNSYAINGGVIANHYHIISSAGACADGVHKVHKMYQRYSYINYDYRMKTKKLLILKQLAPFFK